MNGSLACLWPWASAGNQDGIRRRHVGLNDIGDVGGDVRTSKDLCDSVPPKISCSRARARQIAHQLGPRAKESNRWPGKGCKGSIEIRPKAFAKLCPSASAVLFALGRAVVEGKENALL